MGPPHEGSIQWPIAPWANALTMELHFALIFRRTIQIALNFLHWNVHIFLFWLNPTGHSKFHNTSNHPPPATDSCRTAHTPLYLSVQAVPHYFPPPIFFSCPGQEPTKAGTCARDRRALQQLALNVHVKHSDLTWPDHIWIIYLLYIMTK